MIRKFLLYKTERSKPMPVGANLTMVTGREVMLLSIAYGTNR